MRKQLPWYPIKNDVDCRYKYWTAIFFGLIVKWIIFGAETSLMLPSDYPISQCPSTTLLVAVMNYSRWDVKMNYSEWALILEDLSSVCLILFKYVKITFKSYLSW
jgi:hypothetical protein